MPILMVSCTDQQYLFVKEQQKRGLKPSKVFQDAVDRIHRQVNEGVDLSEIAIAAKFKRFEELVQKQAAYMMKKGCYYDFLEAEKKGRDEFDGIPESKKQG